MLKTMIGLATVLVVTSAAPALACHSGCASGAAVVYHAPVHHIAPPQPRYYVNHGPTFTGPATLAPLPVYQEHGVTGRYPYVSSYPQPYTGGPYADPTNHYSYGTTPSQGPVVYRYHHRPRYAAPARYYAPRFRAAPRYRAPRVAYAPYYGKSPRVMLPRPEPRYAAPQRPRGPVPRYLN